MTPVTSAIAIDERAIEERFVRASGPGGQNVNKVATAVELHFNIRASSLPVDVQDRLIALGGKRVTGDGILVIDSRVHRSQARNREAARERLLALLQRAATPRKPRRPTRPRRAVREGRLVAKKRQGTLKQSRSKRGDEDAEA